MRISNNFVSSIHNGAVCTADKLIKLNYLKSYFIVLYSKDFLDQGMLKLENWLNATQLTSFSHINRVK